MMKHLDVLIAGFKVYCGSSHGAGVLPECSAAITGEKKTFTVELTPPTTPIDFIEWSFTDRNDVSTIIISTNTGPNPDYQDRIHVFPETGSLELRNLILSDIGDYKVIIRVGEVQQTGSCFLYLHELIGGVGIKHTSTDLLESSGSVTMTCFTTAGTDITYGWLNSTNEVKAGDRVQITEGGSKLTITNVNRYDTGPYRCRVSNLVSSSTSGPVELDISYGPENISLSTSPSLEHHKVGSNINLTCSSESNPPAVYQWFFNGTLLPVLGPELRLKNVLESQSGNYRCQAYNNKTLNSLTQSTPISILTPISRVELRTDTTDLIEFSGPVSLLCSATGSSPSFRWANGSSEITKNDRVQITDGGSKLTILNINRYDKGPFRCHAFNPINDGTSNPVVLSVNYGPENINLTKTPFQEHYNEGSDVDLLCSATSVPPPQFRWLKNGELLSHTGPALQLKNIHFNQRGNYSCQAFNDRTQRTVTSDPVSISVIRSEISNVVIIPSKTEMEEFSGSVSLTCTYEGLFPNFVWRNSSSELIAGDGVQIESKGAVVIILNVSRYDEGPYTCHVFNNFSSATSPPLKLSIYYGPENISVSTSPLLQYHPVGSNIHLSCSSGSRPPAVYQWFFNGELLPVSGSELSLRNVLETQSGNYRCQAYNTKTLKSQTKSSTITILTPISRVELRTDTTDLIEFSGAVSLFCSATGSSPSFRWANGSSEITNNDRVQITNGGSKLTILNISRHDTGPFRCHAFNLISNDTSNPVVLSVYFEISNVVIIPSKTEMEEFSGSVSLTCTFDGVSTNIIWRKGSFELTAGDGVQIESKGAVVTILNVSRHDEGPYTCQVFNDFSSATSPPLKLSIYYGPENISVSTSPSLQYHSVGSNIHLSCSSGSRPPAVYHWFFNGGMLPGSGSELSLRNVLESQSGNYRCRAYNNKTMKSQTQSSTITILTPISRVELRTDTTDLIEFSGPVSLVCSATGSSPSFRWANGSSEITNNNRVQITNGGTKLTILNISRHDTGPFRCHAFNLINSDTSNPVVLSVYYGPENIKITKSPVQEHYYEGSNVDLVCSASSSPPPQFRWFKNGELLSHSGPALQLKNIHFHQRGNYSCQAFNNITQRTITSEPLAISVISLEISNVVIIPSKTEMEEFSGSVSLNCSFKGLFPTFAWRNGSSQLTAGDGVQINNNGALVTILNVSRYDEGPYTCQVFNNFSSVTSPPLKLSIYYGPENVYFEIFPPREYFETGSKISMSCSAASRPPALFQWYQNGYLLPYTGSKLNLVNVQEHHSGNYSCRAFNNKTLKYQTTRPSAIIILTPVSNVTLTASPQVMFEFSSTTLYCSSAGTAVSYRWLNGSLEVTADHRVQITNGGSKLTIVSVTRYEETAFRCNVSNAVSDRLSQALHLYIQYGPDYVTIEGPDSVYVGHYAVLLCTTSSVPTASFTWLFNGKPTGVHTAKYVIDLSRSSDAGMYVCTATNAITGRCATGSHNLTVSGTCVKHSDTYNVSDRPSSSANAEEKGKPT
nr:hemicentin-1-like [Nerophis lumbriciformis]